MRAGCIAYHTEQQQRLPRVLQSGLPRDQLAYIPSYAIDNLNLSAFHAGYVEDGPCCKPFHPAMMVKVLVYANATGAINHHKIARNLHEHVEFRALGVDTPARTEPSGTFVHCT